MVLFQSIFCYHKLLQMYGQMKKPVVYYYRKINSMKDFLSMTFTILMFFEIDRAVLHVDLSFKAL